MTVSEFLDKLESVLDVSVVGVLSTVDEQGTPHARWMSPSTMREHKGFLYAVTSPSFKKVAQIEKNPQVHWLIQSKALDKVFALKGKINIIDNPSFKSEVFQALGDRLNIFWRVNQKPEEMIVLETIIEEGSYFEPIKGVRAKVSFKG